MPEEKVCNNIITYKNTIVFAQGMLYGRKQVQVLAGYTCFMLITKYMLFVAAFVLVHIVVFLHM